MCSTTFINQNSENNIVEAGRKSMAGRAEDFELFQSDNDVYENGNDKICAFHEYGLCFDYVEFGTFDDQIEDYFRYQLSYGGPSEEIRFYNDSKIVFVYLDWFSGVGFDVSQTDWAQWLKEFFEECAMMDFQQKREDSDYYSVKYELEITVED